ncbi:MAG: serine protease [bacterium]|nr:serine protease [bacterium]
MSPDSGYWYDREMTRTIAGEYQTAYVPQTVDYYEYAATYWAKSKPPVFGVLARAVINSFAGEVVHDRNLFFELVSATQGRNVTVELMRRGEPRTVTVQLRRDG